MGSVSPIPCRSATQRVLPVDLDPGTHGLLQIPVIAGAGFGYSFAVLVELVDGGARQHESGLSLAEELNEHFQLDDWRWSAARSSQTLVSMSR